MSTRRTLLLTAATFALLVTTGGTLKRGARLRLRGLLHRRLRSKSVPWPTRAPGAVTLIFAPHPDDAELGCGGLIATRREARETIHIVCITDGAASHPGHPSITPADLAGMRAEESRMAASVLGVGPAGLHFLGAPDGRLPHLSTPERQALVTKMAVLVRDLRPTEVFVTSDFDGSTEHSAACALVRDALGAANPGTTSPALFQYFVWARWSPQRLWAALRSGGQVHVVDFASLSERKQRAIAAHRSQTEPLPPQASAALSEEFVRAFKTPEEFFLHL